MKRTMTTPAFAFLLTLFFLSASLEAQTDSTRRAQPATQTQTATQSTTQTTQTQTVQAPRRYSMPEVMDTADLKAQLRYLDESTRVYNGFRAVREELFRRTKQNVEDTLTGLQAEIARLNGALASSSFEKEALQENLERTKNERDQAIRNRDSLSFLGIQMGKGLYSSIMWIALLILAVAGAALFLLFKRSHGVTSHTRRELETLQEEYDEYRKSAREKYEKLVVSHHQEIMKLKKT
ncbi:MAG: hypothetical protein R2751_03245 [Bacteroidales bacterium]